MGLNKRLKMYVKDDRPLKLKSCLASHEASARKIKFSHGRSLLHYCAEFGSPEMLRCLLNLGCDPSHQDRAGMLPLHTALYRALSEDLKQAKETYVDMVCALVEVYPLALDVDDLDMKTGQDLLTSLKHKLKSGRENERQRVDKEEEERLEREWKDKLTQEFQFEAEEQQSRYNLNDDLSEEETKETISDWSNRIYKEYSAKRRLKNPAASQSRPRKYGPYSNQSPGSSSSKAKKREFHEAEDEKLKNAREEMKKRYKPPPVETTSERYMSKKKIYESKFSRFALHPPSGKCVTFGAVPWPCTHIEELVAVLFCDLKDKASSQFKKYLRTQKVRWHPDKFSQKFRNHLHPDHVDKIMGRVNGISQTLNALSD